MRDRRFVVTGGAGFIGHHTSQALLAEGAAVLVLDDLRHACPAGAPAEAELVVAEISSPEAAAAIAGFKPDAVLHLAAQAGVNRSRRDPAGDAQTNVVGTVGLIKACLDAGVARLVMASTGGAMYGHADQLPTPETAPARPVSPYGAAKLACEGYLGMFERSWGLRPLVLRYGNVYGPLQDGTGEAGLVAITSTRLLQGLAPVIRGDGGQTRDFVFVEDVADANRRALTSEATGILNVGSGLGTSVRHIVEHLIAASGKTVQPEFAELPSGEVRDSRLDISQARSLLGWNPGVGLEEGLTRTFRSFEAAA